MKYNIILGQLRSQTVTKKKKKKKKKEGGERHRKKWKTKERKNKEEGENVENTIQWMKTKKVKKKKKNRGLADLLNIPKTMISNGSTIYMHVVKWNAINCFRPSEVRCCAFLWSYYVESWKLNTLFYFHGRILKVASTFLMIISTMKPVSTGSMLLPNIIVWNKADGSWPICVID